VAWVQAADLISSYDVESSLIMYISKEGTFKPFASRFDHNETKTKQLTEAHFFDFVGNDEKWRDCKQFHDLSQ
jgi:hypothetical protein